MDMDKEVSLNIDNEWLVFEFDEGGHNGGVVCGAKKLNTSGKISVFDFDEI